MTPLTKNIFSMLLIDIFIHKTCFIMGTERLVITARQCHLTATHMNLFLCMIIKKCLPVNYFPKISIHSKSISEMFLLFQGKSEEKV